MEAVTVSKLEKSKLELNCGKNWNDFILKEFQKPYMQNLINFLESRYDLGATVYPPLKDIFQAFSYTTFHNTKVVILGQDPYHGVGQAHGLCFSVRKGVKLPPSLQNIFKEINADLGIEFSGSGDLSHWAKQGVLLLNSVLTVEEGMAGAHQGKGWEEFTDNVIRLLNSREEPIVFVLWGSYAQKKGQIINNKKHLVLSSAHPSPLSAYRGFFGNSHFSKINKFLRENSIKEIDWSLK